MAFGETAKGYKNLDFMGNLGHSIETSPEQRLWFDDENHADGWNEMECGWACGIPGPFDGLWSCAEPAAEEFFDQ